MATVAYISARMLVDGAELSASLHDLTLNYTAEMLDNTAFGDTSRTFVGGLLNVSIDGEGFGDFGQESIEQILFNRQGTSDVVVAVFPEAITEGSQSGYAMLGVPSQFDLGGTIGDLCNITFSIQGRGLTQG